MNWKRQRGFIGGGVFQHNHSSAVSGGLLADAGQIVPFAGTVVPANFLPCDGAAVSRTLYTRLFTAIGVTWGPGDGATTFNVPDMRRRIPVGSGGVGTGTLGNAVGNTGGAETHALILAENAPHTHTQDNEIGGAGQGAGGVQTATDFSGTKATGSSGSGTAHNNIQPSAIVLAIIKT